MLVCSGFLFLPDLEYLEYSDLEYSYFSGCPIFWPLIIAFSYDCFFDSFIDLFIIFLFGFSFIYFCSDLYYFLLVTLNFVDSSFSISLRCKVRLFIWDFFLEASLYTISFPLRSDFSVSHTFWKRCVYIFTYHKILFKKIFFFDFFNDPVIIVACCLVSVCFCFSFFLSKIDF